MESKKEQIDKDKLEESDYDQYSYPLFELGWKVDVQIHPLLYTMKEWQARNYSVFFKNIEKKGIVL